MRRFRAYVALAGILLALIALWRDDPRVTWVAIGVLAVAVLLRFVASRKTPPDA